MFKECSTLIAQNNLGEKWGRCMVLKSSSHCNGTKDLYNTSSFYQITFVMTNIVQSEAVNLLSLYNSLKRWQTGANLFFLMRKFIQGLLISRVPALSHQLMPMKEHYPTSHQLSITSLLPSSLTPTAWLEEKRLITVRFLPVRVPVSLSSFALPPSSLSFSENGFSNFLMAHMTTPLCRNPFLKYKGRYTKPNYYVKKIMWFLYIISACLYLHVCTVCGAAVAQWFM